MPPKGKKGGAFKKKPSLYKKPPPIPLEEKLCDTNGRSWIVGPSIGVGGFGEIYSACEYFEGTYDKSDYPYVVKIEPIENGPLFVECNFYKRNYNEDDIADFMDSRGLSQLGMPVFLGTGEHWLQEGNKKTHLRFLILERYGTDINKKFKECGRFPAPTVFLLGLQVLDVLDYVHSRSYIHADIKGANILLGIQPGTEHQAYLLDFGLAWRVVGHNYKPDPNCAHEGTLEYTSTDRHIGAQTMRGDLEILAYNMLQWLTGSLPWEGIEDPNTVHKMKAQLVENVRDRIERVPDHLFKFFEYIKTLDMPDVPNHASCRKIFESYLTSVGKTRQSKLEFPLLARNNITNMNVATSDLIVKLINLPKAKPKSVTTYAVSQEKGDKNQKKPIQRRSSKKPSMDSKNSNKLERSKFKPKSIKGPETNSTESTGSDEPVLTKETAVQKAKFELDEDFAYALELHRELNNESLGDSNNGRPRRNIKAPDRLGFTNTPAEITPKPCNNPVKKLKKRNLSVISSILSVNVTKDIDTSKNYSTTKELNNEIEAKEINRRVETNKISIIDLDSTNELSNENVIENKKLTSPKGKETKLVIPKESFAVAPLKQVYESEDISDQENSYPKCTKIKKSTSLEIPEAKQKYLKNKKVNEMKVEYESEQSNDDLEGLPEVSFNSSHSKNSSIKSLRDDSIASSSARKNKTLNKHMYKIEQEIDENYDIEVLRNNDSTSKKSIFSEPKGESTSKRERDKTRYGEFIVERINELTDTCTSESRDNDASQEKNKESRYEWDNNVQPKLKKKKKNSSSETSSNNVKSVNAEVCRAKQRNRHSKPDTLSTIKLSENDTLVCVANESFKLNNTSESISSTDDIIENSVIEDQPNKRKHKKLTEKMSVTETNNKSDLELDGEHKSKKKKINKSKAIGTSEINDTDGSRITKSSDFSSDVKQSECEDDDFQPKPDKYKNKYKSSDACTSKSADTNLIPSPGSMDDAKDSREKEDGEPQAKKKKKNKSSYSSAYDGMNAYYCTRRNSSSFGKDSKTVTKKVSEHSKQPELTDVPKTETTNDITKKKKKKTKTREDRGSDGDFDSKYRSLPANKNKK